MQPFKQHLFYSECELNPGRNRTPQTQTPICPSHCSRNRSGRVSTAVCSAFRRKSRELRQARLYPQDASAQPSSNRYRTNWPYFLLQSLTQNLQLKFLQTGVLSSAPSDLRISSSAHSSFSHPNKNVSLREKECFLGNKCKHLF